ncbi:hypothetical protein [Longispora fulva]|uniref:Uncharacterized protein n=1 Tax=Longispora fulva TaxID=619741 RepID=A0A8J7GJ07_9ACTN|nr:hypothetical protein [Longispora fulva]MBG6138415.1 hypothetical protein [Longispora fulva]
MAESSPGTLKEAEARSVAGLLGVPDFVYRPEHVSKGKAVREISDGLLIAGTDGLILQVKGRFTSGRDLPAKAEGWCRKNGLAAQRQGQGTRASLRSNAVRVRSLRGYEREVPDAETWPIVVIISHPDDPVVSFPASTDTLFLSLTDWRQLHSMIRSTYGVIDYVRRALASGVSVPLGREADRYRLLSEADVHAGRSLTSFPTLPIAELDGRDLGYVATFDRLIAKVADGTGATGWTEDGYLLPVEQLDRVPITGRVRIGRKWSQTFFQMVETKSPRSFITLDPNGADRLAFMFEHDAEGSDDSAARFNALVADYCVIRHQHAIDAGADPASVTLTVGTLYHPTKGQRYTFVYWQGPPPPIPTVIRTAFESEFGVFNGATVQSATT